MVLVKKPALEAVVVSIPCSRKANTPNSSSPSAAACPRVRHVVRRSCGRNSSATAANASEKRSAVRQKGPSPSSPTFIMR